MERMPPPTVSGMKTSSAVRRTPRAFAPLVGGGDVEEDELVRALGVVARGELDGIARVADIDEVHALDHAAGVDVEAGDHTLEVHALQATWRRPRREPRGALGEVLVGDRQRQPRLARAAGAEPLPGRDADALLEQEALGRQPGGQRHHA